MNIKIGDLVSFYYAGTKVHDSFPQVLILHPSWNRWPNRAGGKPYIHGLNFNYLTDDEINMIRMLIDPGFEMKYIENLAKKNPGIAAEYDRIITKAENTNITDPHAFYLNAIKPFIRQRGWDPYRLYDPTKLKNLRVVKDQKYMLGESKMSMFGTKPPRGNGKDEKDILASLAEKDVNQDKSREKLLSPTEERFISRLQGRARSLFQNYKTKFQAMRGPTMNMRTPNFNGNQPSWMNDEEL